MCACSHELAASPTLNLPAHHPILDAQRQIYGIINKHDTNFGVFEGAHAVRS
jgi:hypothetical protein